MTGNAVGSYAVGSFSVETVELDGYAELHLVGELDLETADCLAQALQQVYDRGVPHLVFDLSRLDFIDSTGLRQLVVARAQQQSNGGDIVLHAPNDKTRRVLDIVGMRTLFTIT